MDTLSILVESQLPGEAERMNRVVLSTTEAEYMALSEVVKELKLVVQFSTDNEYWSGTNYHCGNLVVQQQNRY